MKTVILGGGLAGLSAAWHAQDRVEYSLYEKEISVGGLCRSFEVNGFTFDYSGHLLHLRNPYFRKLIFELLGEDTLVGNIRDARIYSKGVYTRYPFQENTYGLPAKVKYECLEGFHRAEQWRTEEPSYEPTSFADWINYQFGVGIAKHFMIPYNEKMFTIPPGELSTEWLGRFVPKASWKRMVAGSKADLISDQGYNANFYYPRDGGIETLVKALARKLDRVMTKKAAIKIDVANQKVLFDNNEEAIYDKLLSTIPLPKLLDLIEEIPEGVKKAGDVLKHNSVYCLNIAVNRNEINPAHWVYFPEADISFYRVGFYSNINPHSGPDGASSLYAEVAYSKDRPLDKATIRDRIIADLCQVGILNADDDILAEQALDIEYAYVLFDFKRQKAVHTIIEYLDSVDIKLAGRYAEWSYSAMEDALISGKNAIEEIIATCGG